MGATSLGECLCQGIQIGSEELKLPLFTDDMISYAVNPNIHTKKITTRTNEYAQQSFRICDLNIQKSILSLYTRNEQWKNKIKKTIPFTIASTWIEYLGMYLTKL